MFRLNFVGQTFTSIMRHREMSLFGIDRSPRRGFWAPTGALEEPITHGQWSFIHQKEDVQIKIY